MFGQRLDEPSVRSRQGVEWTLRGNRVYSRLIFAALSRSAKGPEKSGAWLLPGLCYVQSPL